MKKETVTVTRTSLSEWLDSIGTSFEHYFEWREKHRGTGENPAFPAFMADRTIELERETT